MSNLGRQFSSIYRGLHVPRLTPDTSDDEILSKVSRRPWPADEAFERKRLAEAPEVVDRWPVYGEHWTTSETTAKEFALRNGHNMGYRPLPDDRERTGVMLEAHHTAPEVQHSEVQRGYGEQEVHWPGRSNITGFTAHVVHDVGRAARAERYRAEDYGGSSKAAFAAYNADRERIVRSFPMPEEHWKPEWAR